tara:strand:- start:18443 stop:18727 length:285 start_codon:yes stop_codon:yes gene_type:complete
MAKKTSSLRSPRVTSQSPYSIAYDCILKLYNEKGSYLTVDEVQETFESTAKLVFPARTTIYEVIEKLGRWNLIAFIKPEGLEERVIIPLSQKKD